MSGGEVKREGLDGGPQGGFVDGSIALTEFRAKRDQRFGFRDQGLGLIMRLIGSD